MHDSPNIWPVLHDRQVQQDLAGPLLRSSKLVPIEVDHANVVRSHKAFTDHCWAAKDFVLANTIGDVPIVGGCKAFSVDASSDFDDLVLDFRVVEEWMIHGFVYGLEIESRVRLIV